MQIVPHRFLAPVLVAMTIVAIMAAAYASVVFAPLPTTPKATWTIDPLALGFAAAAGSGSAVDFVSCSPSAGSVQLLAKSSNPAKVALSTFPSGFSCGSTTTSITITATCLVPAAQCVGSYSGQVQVRQPANYRNLSSALSVRINVT